MYSSRNAVAVVVQQQAAVREPRGARRTVVVGSIVYGDINAGKQRASDAELAMNEREGVTMCRGWWYTCISERVIEFERWA